MEHFSAHFDWIYRSHGLFMTKYFSMYFLRTGIFLRIRGQFSALGHFTLNHLHVTRYFPGMMSSTIAVRVSILLRSSSGCQFRSTHCTWYLPRLQAANLEDPWCIRCLPDLDIRYSMVWLLYQSQVPSNLEWHLHYLEVWRERLGGSLNLILALILYCGSDFDDINGHSSLILLTFNATKLFHSKAYLYLVSKNTLIP